MAGSLGNDILLIPVLFFFFFSLPVWFLLMSIFFSFLSFASLVWQTYAYYACTLALSGVYWQNFLFFCIFAVGSKSSYFLALSIIVPFISLLSFTFFPPAFSIAFLFVCLVE